MLTSDLLRVRIRGNTVFPMYLQPEQMTALLPLAESLIDVFQTSVGSTIAELDEAVREVSDAQTDRLRVGGLVKLLRDRCEVDATAQVDPVELRAEVYSAASHHWQSLGVRDVFDREAVLARCASAHGVSVEQLQAMMFADLPGAQILRDMRSISAMQLLQRYNLALAQGVLLRATRLKIQLAPTTAPRFRQLMRAIKFRRLMFRIEGSAQDGYEIELDGPMSLFESTQRYGLQLAMFLPTLVASEGWQLEAQLRWGKTRTESVFRLKDTDGLVSDSRHDTTELEEITQLFETFSRLDSQWHVKRTSKVFHLKGKAVFAPDLVFEQKGSKQRVYLEAFGYWNRDAVFDRVQVLQQGFPERFVLAVSKKLRVSPEIADDRFPGRIIVYSGTLSANSVCRTLDEIVQHDGTA